MIKLFDPHVTEEEVTAARDVILSHNWASGAGANKVRVFEEVFKSYLGTEAVVALNSGTAALHLALYVSGIGKSNVLLPSLSFVSTAHAVRFNNANPIFVDVDPNTLCIDKHDLENKIRKEKCSAILPVHFGGMPCDMNALIKISKSYGLKIVDDSAHACGSSYDGKKIGTFGQMTCFSFHPIKNLAMPTGGAISINDQRADGLKTRLNSLRWCGIDDRHDTSYDVTSITPNYYMNEISAAIGLVQLNKLDYLNARRRDIAKRYSNEIECECRMPYSRNCVYHLYWLIVHNREDLIKYLNDRGIEVGTHYRPIHTMSAYASRDDRWKIPITEMIGNKIVTIPIHPNLTDDEITYIINSINSYLRLHDNRRQRPIFP